MRNSKNLFFHIYNTSNTDRDTLEELETVIQPDIDGGTDGGCLTIESVGNHQEVVRSNAEEFPVICPGRGQSLVHLKQLKGRDRGRETIQQEAENM